MSRPGDVPFQRRPTNSKLYGKKAARRSSTLPSPLSRPPRSASSDSDSDDAVASSLLSKSTTAAPADKGKGKAKESPTAAPPARRAQTSSGVSNPRASGGSVVKSMGTRRVLGAAEASSSKATGAGLTAGAATAWDEETAITTKRSSAGSAKPARRTSAPNPKVEVAEPSPSPPKRARTSAGSTSTRTTPPPSRTRASPDKPKQSSPLKPRDNPMDIEPPPAVAVPSPAGASPASKAAVPTELEVPDSPPRRKRVRTRPSVPELPPQPAQPRPTPPAANSAPLANAAGSPSSKTATAVKLYPATPSSPVQQRPRTPEPSTSRPSSRPASPSPLKSPAKDLSKVFELFKAGEGGSSLQLQPTVPANQEVKRTQSAVAAMAGRSTDRAKSPECFSRASSTNSSPERPHSQPNLSPASQSSRHPSSARPLGHSSSFPQTGSPSRPPTPTKPISRPLSRNNTMASMNVSAGAVDASALGPRGVGGARKTYGGARSFKRDVEEERIFAGAPSGAEAVPRISAPAAAGPSTTSRSSPATHPNSSARKLFLPTLPRPPQERRSYAAMRTALGVDEEEMEEESQGPSALKSITQLRAKGENSRFVDEFNYLVEGLQSGESLGGRRATAIEVLRKMLSRDFVRRLKASGFDERAYTEFRKAEAGEGDRVLDPALAFLIAVLARDQRIAEALCRITTSTFGSIAQGTHIDDDAIYDEPTCDVLSVLGAMLSRSWAGEEIGAKEVKGLSKGDVRTLLTLREVIDQAELLEGGSLPTNLRSLSLLAISIISSLTPRAIFRPQHLLCTSGALDAVVAALVVETKEIDARVTRYESGMALLPPDGSINLRFIDLCLHVFEASTSATPYANSILTSHSSSLAPSLVHLIHASHILALEPDSQSLVPEQQRKATASAAMDCLLSGLRMLIDMTTNDPEWCPLVAEVPGVIPVLIKLILAARSGDEAVGARFREVSSPAPEEAESEMEDDGGGEEKGEIETQGKKQARQDARFDLLCLALGVLTNLVESVEETKDLLRETLIDPSCKEHRKCVRTCHCAGRASAILRLTALYLDPLQDSPNEVNRAFVNGYSGILLGLLMLDCPPNQDLITDALSSDPEAKQRLVEAMQDFATLHEEKEKVEAAEREERGEEGGVSQGTVMDEDGEELEREKCEGDVAERIRRMLDRLKRG